MVLAFCFRGIYDNPTSQPRVVQLSGKDVPDCIAKFKRNFPRVTNVIDVIAVREIELTPEQLESAGS